MVIQAIITNNIAPLATTVVVTSLITLYYYLKNLLFKFYNFEHITKMKYEVPQK